MTIKNWTLAIAVAFTLILTPQVRAEDAASAAKPAAEMKTENAAVDAKSEEKAAPSEEKSDCEMGCDCSKCKKGKKHKSCKNCKTKSKGEHKEDHKEEHHEEKTM